MFQKLQKQHVVQQQQLEKQIQLLQQQQQMLLPGRVSGEGAPAEPREPGLSRGSTSQLLQSSGPSARLMDLANGMVSPDPAVPAAAEGVCGWERARCGGLSVCRCCHPKQEQRCPTDERAAAQLRWEEKQDLLLDKHGLQKQLQE